MSAESAASAAGLTPAPVLHDSELATENRNIDTTTSTAGGIAAAATTTDATTVAPTSEAPTATTGTTGAVAAATTAAVTPSAAAPPSNMLSTHAIPITSLPEHPALANSAKAGNPSAQSFAASILADSLDLIDITMPKSWTSAGGSKKIKPCSSEIRLYKFDTNRVREPWYLRRSTHANDASPGTFTWEEMDQGLRLNHSSNEAAYTDDIYDWFQVCKWDSAELARVGEEVSGVSEVEMYVVEMLHKLPTPLSPRCFAELVVTCKTFGANKGSANTAQGEKPGLVEGKSVAGEGGEVAEEGLVVVQVPVELSNCPAAMYSNGRNKKEGSSLLKQKAVQIGTYASIERGIKTSTGVLQWTMGTASDAKGGIPMMMQRMSIGGAIAKDPPMFVKWIMDKRPAEVEYQRV